MKNVLVIMDRLLCGFLGLEKEETVPHFVGKKGNKIIVLNTESFKRHAQQVPIDNVNFSSMNKENKEKLGRAVGKAIATNLVISFDEITIKRESMHAR